MTLYHYEIIHPDFASAAKIYVDGDVISAAECAVSHAHALGCLPDSGDVELDVRVRSEDQDTWHELKVSVKLVPKYSARMKA